MQKLAGLILVPFLAALCFFILIGFVKPDIHVRYNGQPVAFQGAKPMMYDDGANTSIVAPADLLAAEIGASVQILPDTGTMTLKKSADTITFYDGKDTAVVNGREKKMAVRALLKEGHFYVPVRFLGENLGKTVFWEASTSSLHVFDSVKNSFDLDADAKKYISAANFSVMPGRLSFYNEAADFRLRPSYMIQERLNPAINGQIYEMARSLVDKNCYLYVDYYTKTKSSSAGPAPYVNIALASTQAQAKENDMLFFFTFYEKTPISPRKIWKHNGFSAAAPVKLELNRLYEGENPEGSWIDPFFENRLKLAFVALFKESTGLGICDYLLQEYNQIRSDTEGKYNSYKKTRRFDHVRVDLAYGVYPNSTDTLYVYFSF